MVEYTATFFIVKPIDMSKASGLLWHDVPNRGGRVTIVDAEKAFGDVGISSGWQGDNQGGTDQTRTNNDWVHVPTAFNADGSSITGTVLARIINPTTGPTSAGLFVQANPFPYLPATFDTTKATLTEHLHETMTGLVTLGNTIASADWAWAHCDATHPFPGTPSGTEICLRNGFDGNKLYQVVFTAKDPLVLGVGFAAFRDVESFFKHAVADDNGQPNPIARSIRFSISRGVSQSGNFLRGWLHLGFNQDEAGRQVSDGMWPIIAGRRINMNARWAQPDGVLELYEPGSEGPQWWSDYEDNVRGLPQRGILDRCHDTHTCPKIIEHFGAAEIWELKLGIEWVGTDGKQDIPIPENVRRYYIPSTTHGGTTTPAGTNLFDFVPNNPSCPGNKWGTGALKGNPIPHTETVNAIRVHFRDWVMKGKNPPDNFYPRINTPGKDAEDHDGNGRGGNNRANMVTPTLAAMGFPSGVPQLKDLAPRAPEAATINGVDETPFINPVLDYDWGPEFDPNNGSGIPTNFPPPIKHVINMLVPRTDSDGNELGGVPVVLRDAPLGSYFGWNITSAGFHKSQNCDYTGGYVPFSVTKADRIASGDPRPSLQERYETHAGYVAAVQAAAAHAVASGFLLQADADSLIAAAQASHVLN
ncbi:MAG TPA: alpha/beta hydrolase domain-containing protein [Candidatus Angelobacter sp.]|nr:alpha/beta hydrolase domain-containing protein [Candidatus Angelobacter sp.]